MLQLLKMNHPDYKVIHNEYVISVVNSVRKKMSENIICTNSHWLEELVKSPTLKFFSSLNILFSEYIIFP